VVSWYGFSACNFGVMIVWPFNVPESQSFWPQFTATSGSSPRMVLVRRSAIR
jgi:hypothetical protein